MEPELEKIREVQKEAWNKSSAGWKKWDDMTMNFMRPAGDEIIHTLQLKDTDTVLDVATGTGEPGLTMATMLTHGKVIATDLAEEMLAVAAENAAKRNIKNFATRCCDVSALPFEDNTFDAVSCRFGFNLFPDMRLALNEMIRVLKPGGRIATGVWGAAEKNSWIATSMGTMISMLQLKPPAPGTPGVFRCAEQGLMTGLFAKAGLKNITQKEVAGKLICGTLDMYWSFITETSSPVAFSKADDGLKLQIKEEILGKVKQKYPAGNIAFDSSAIVICGVK